MGFLSYSHTLVFLTAEVGVQATASVIGHISGVTSCDLWETSRLSPCWPLSRKWAPGLAGLEISCLK